jgi:hypothetical protein
MGQNTLRIGANPPPTTKITAASAQIAIPIAAREQHPYVSSRP